MAYNKKFKEVKENKLVALKKPNDTLWACVCVAVIAVITFFVFSPSLDDGFTNWDDITYVTENPLVVNNSIPVVKIFETPVAANYHPITILTLALNYQYGELDPLGYHLENVIFHILNTILVFFFIFLLTQRNLLMASIVSLFFGIHPMHVESVTWISERKDVLYVFFFMGGLITYLLYSETKKIGWYIFTFLLFILSCLSKGMAIVFPFILLLIDYLKGVKWRRRVLFEKIPFFLVALVFGVIAIIIQQSSKTVTAMNVFTVFQRLMFVCFGAVMYIVRLFVPVHLSAFYPYPITNRSSIVPFIFYLQPVIVLGLIVALIYFFRKKEKEIVFGLLFYFVTIIMVLQFISVGRVIMADRYSYLSYVGLLFIVAYVINKVWLNKGAVWSSLKYPVILITIAGAVIFSFQTYAHTQVWKNSETLWTDAIDNYPDAYIAYYDRASYFYNINDAENAISDYTKDIQLNPYDRDAYYYRGLLYSRFYNKNDLAIADYSTAINIDSTFADAYSNRGLLYSKESKDNLAITDFTKAIEFNSQLAEAYNDRGALYLRNGKNDLAIADYDKAVALNPSSAPCYYNRGLYYTAINQYEKASDDFTKGIQLNPPTIELFYDMRGICNINLQKYDEAIADFSRAIELNPSVAGYWLNRSFAESKVGENENAKADALRGQQLRSK